MSEETTESSITTPIGGLSFKGKKTAEFIALTCLCLLLLLAYIQWEQKKSAEAAEVSLSKRDDTIALAIKDMAQSNRVLACLMATPQDQREAKLPVCERIAR